MKTAWLLLSTFATLVGFLVIGTILLSVLVTTAGMLGISLYFVLALVLLAIFGSLATRRLFTTGRKAH